MIDTLVAFYNNYTEIAIAIIAALVIFVILKPKEIFKVIGAIIVIIVIAYLVMALMDLTGKGIDKKGEATHRTDKSFNDSENAADR